ncbi:hypothetical protein CIG75_09395 [Tumebacillus algifaecis]|uniref:DUF3189 domain-containing protein n=1 Tax=Tumebacillus algifaecis TaxID=1214604 RepID=A0A223D114_9BACL|nr:DUF3189 family protein [Tumebacillus algifaecis]ASS75175.1 hypothetical protein CIG75_09395 [Tumebacillus algifaecis]
MHIIYHCYGSAHSSVVAAAIHLGRLPSDRVPSHEEVLKLADYDSVESWQIGTLFFKGHDEWANPIYTLGLGKESKRSKQALVTFLELLNIDTAQLFFNEALPHINVYAKVGGALSRRYGIVRLGRPLSAYGIRRGYFQLVRFVQQVKAEVEHRMQGMGRNG